MRIPIKPGVPMKMDADDKRTFDEWMKAVDVLLERTIGVSSMDLPDCSYRDWYDARLRPIRAANRALDNFLQE